MNYKEAFHQVTARQKEFNDRNEESIRGLAGDIAEMQRLITQLQESAGDVTPEDQATIDALQNASDSIAGRFKALDDLTPPAAPAPTE